MKTILKPKYINDTALDILRREGVFLCADCGGHGTCGKCRIRVPECAIAQETEGDAGRCMPEPSEAESKLLSKTELDSGIRLACCFKVGEMPGVQDGTEEGIEVEIPESSLIRDTFDSAAITKPEHLKPAEIIAVDYGTTVITGALVDLNLGVVNEAAVVNHQKSYGADVISRIRAANDGYHEELRHVSEDDLADLTVRLGRDPDMARYIISGNTVMGHLVSGFSCRGLGEFPYSPVDISLRRDGNITFLPGISAFVGADIVSGICACSLDQAPDPWLYVDIGTNGEMAIGTGTKILAASAPAGPAFEGGGLSCGVPAIPGAVSGLVLAGSKSIPTVIEGSSYDAYGAGGGSQAPCGICGSGIVDLIAELLKNRLIDENGTLVDEFEEEGFVIAGDVLVTQKDIREIQKAKAAIRAGIEVLIEESGSKYEDIKKLVLAGSFGSSINMENAARIGLVPEKLLPVSATAGNSSLTGATLYALDTGFGARLKKVAEEADTVDLAQAPGFGTRYIRYMGF